MGPVRSFLPLLLLLATACGPTLVELRPVPAEGQDLTWVGGTGLLRATGQAVDVTVAPAGDLGAGRYPLEDLIPLFMQVRNVGAARFDVAESSVAVTAGNPKHPAGRQRVRVLRGREMADRALNDASVSNGIIGFFAITDLVMTTAAVAGARTPEQQEEAMYMAAQSGAVLAAQSDAAAALLQHRLGIASRVLQRTTLQPGQEVRGLLLVERPKLPGCSTASRPLSCRLEVAIAAGGEKLLLVFDEQGE
jgi:hypothetical protein